MFSHHNAEKAINMSLNCLSPRFLEYYFKNQVHFVFNSICHPLSVIQQGENMNVLHTSSHSHV